MLIYGVELEIVIHHDFIESSIVNVAREKWTETAKWDGGGGGAGCGEEMK